MTEIAYTAIVNVPEEKERINDGISDNEEIERMAAGAAASAIEAALENKGVIREKTINGNSDLYNVFQGASKDFSTGDFFGVLKDVARKGIESVPEEQERKFDNTQNSNEIDKNAREIAMNAVTS